MSVSRQGKVQWQELSDHRRCPGHQVAKGDSLGDKEGYLLLQNLKNQGHRYKHTGSVLTQSKRRHSFSWHRSRPFKTIIQVMMGWGSTGRRTLWTRELVAWPRENGSLRAMGYLWESQSTNSISTIVTLWHFCDNRTSMSYPWAAPRLVHLDKEATKAFLILVRFKWREWSGF